MSINIKDDYMEDLKELEEILGNDFIKETVNCKLPNHGKDLKDKDLSEAILEFMAENEELFKEFGNDSD